MACILLWSSAVRVDDSHVYRKMDVTREHFSLILEVRYKWNWDKLMNKGGRKGSITVITFIYLHDFHCSASLSRLDQHKLAVGSLMSSRLCACFTCAWSICRGFVLNLNSRGCKSNWQRDVNFVSGESVFLFLVILLAAKSQWEVVFISFFIHC